MNQRPIKFRAYDIVTGTFIYSNDLDSETQLFRLYDFFKECIKIGTYDVPLQQSTGLFDKNNKEIYEGDILKIYIGGDLQDNPYIVKDIRTFYFDTNNSDSYLRITEYKIIGNTLETPNLIK